MKSSETAHIRVAISGGMTIPCSSEVGKTLEVNTASPSFTKISIELESIKMRSKDKGKSKLWERFSPCSI